MGSLADAQVLVIFFFFFFPPEKSLAIVTIF